MFRCQLSVMQWKTIQWQTVTELSGDNKNVKVYWKLGRQSLSFLTWHVLKCGCGSHSGLSIHACTLSSRFTINSHFHLPHSLGYPLCLCSSTLVHSLNIASCPQAAAVWQITWLSSPVWHGGFGEGGRSFSAMLDAAALRYCSAPCSEDPVSQECPALQKWHPAHRP